MGLLRHVHGGPGRGPGLGGLRTGGPGIAALLQTATAFPSLAPVLSPLIASQLKGQQGFSGVATPGSHVFQGGQLVATVPQARKEPKIVEVQDPNDPTKTMFVTPSQALSGGFAGVPRSNFTVETVTDPSTGQTRTILTRGSGAGTASGSGLGKSTVGKLEQGITQATTQLDRLQQIRQGFNTRFLELPEQLRQKGLGALEKLGFDVGPENRAQMRQFTRFASSATRNLNRLLNELSGAAVSPAEAKRLTAELPTLKDSPSQFLAKMEDAEASIAAAVRRNQELLARGVENLEFNARGEVSNAPAAVSGREPPVLSRQSRSKMCVPEVTGVSRKM